MEFLSYMYNVMYLSVLRNGVDVSPGRPSISVDMYEVEFWKSFTWTDIARILEISHSTLYRRIAECGLPIQGYTNITDTSLDSLVRELKQTHPNDGEVTMAAHLRARRISIPRARLCASIHRIDPNASENRRAAIRRRTYSVASQIVCGI